VYGVANETLAHESADALPNGIAGNTHGLGKMNLAKRCSRLELSAENPLAKQS
jgi:hypothetical protein